MGADTAVIQMKFSQAIKQAEELDNISKNLKKIADEKFEVLASDIAESWTGENSEHYIKKLTQVEYKVGRTAEDLGKTAVTIRTIAQKIYDAEMEAFAIANSRVYGLAQDMTEKKG